MCLLHAIIIIIMLIMFGLLLTVTGWEGWETKVVVVLVDGITTHEALQHKNIIDSTSRDSSALYLAYEPCNAPTLETAEHRASSTQPHSSDDL